MLRTEQNGSAVLFLTVFALVFWPFLAAAQTPQEPAYVNGISMNAWNQIAALQQEKASWTPAQRKLSSKLLLASKVALGQSLAEGLPQARSGIQTNAEGLTRVDIDATVTGALLKRIQELGGTVLNSHPAFHAIRAMVPLSQLQALAAESEVRSIRPGMDPFLNKTNTSQGDVAHEANTARTTYGVDGTGVKVGVISDSAGATNRTALQTSGDLPATITILPGQTGTGSDEGLAMMEIVFDLAPGASLYFATANGGQAQFAQNILDLQAAGCQVIVDDVGYFAEPVFQDGVVAQAVETVAAAGVAYFSSAGNSGNKDDGTAGVYEGDYVGMAVPAILASYAGASVHDFGKGQYYDVITADTSSYFTLQWADEMASSANDYDLFLLDSTSSTVIDFSNSGQTGSQQPFEIIDSTSRNDVNNRLVVMKYSGADLYFHLNANRGRLSITTAGQTWGHSCTDNGFGVAAVPYYLAGGAGGVFNGTEVVETFSSDGPRRVFFNAAGTPITPGNFSSTGGAVRNKPDVAAADGVACATPGFNPFFGTSAAAPHAGAVAALLIAQGTATTPASIRATIASTALDIEAAGLDRDSGYGIFDAMTALGTPLPVTLSGFKAD